MTVNTTMADFATVAYQSPSTRYVVHNEKTLAVVGRGHSFIFFGIGQHTHTRSAFPTFSVGCPEPRQIQLSEPTFPHRVDAPTTASPHLAILRSVDRHSTPNPLPLDKRNSERSVSIGNTFWTPPVPPRHSSPGRIQSTGSSSMRVIDMEALEDSFDRMSRTSTPVPKSPANFVANKRPQCTNPMGVTLWHCDDAEPTVVSPPVLVGVVLSPSKQFVRPTAMRAAAPPRDGRWLAASSVC